MSTLTYTVADDEFDDGEAAQGTEVRTRFTDLKTFLESNLLDATNNIKVTSAYPWTGTHSWTISDANNDNLSLVIGAVMASGKYGFHISSSVAQTVSSMIYCELTNASSSVPFLEIVDAGTGDTINVTKSGDGSAFSGTQSGTGNSADVCKMSQAGTGNLYGGTLRTFAGLNSAMTSKVLTTNTTVDNTATETVVSDLTLALPANFLKAGTTIRGKVQGTIATPGAGVPSATLTVKYGDDASPGAATALLSSGAVTHTTSLAGSHMELSFTLTCKSIGASGTIEAQGLVQWGSNTAPASRGMGTGGTGAANTSTITIDTTAQKDIFISLTWGSAVSGATAVFRAGHMEILR